LPAIVKRRCKIGGRNSFQNGKKAPKPKKQNGGIREKAYFQAFQQFCIVSISLLRCLFTPVDIFPILAKCDL
jgi:hypothetical protein